MEMTGIWLYKRKFAEISWQFRYAESIEKTHSKVSITLLFIIFLLALRLHKRQLNKSRQTLSSIHFLKTLFFLGPSYSSRNTKNADISK